MNNDSELRITLLEYLLQHGWKPARDSGREEVAGLCPLHRETRPSFYVNRRKQLFYCHGCGRGGGLARLRQLLDDWTPVPSAVANRTELLEQTYSFYQQHFMRSQEGRHYLAQRGIHDPAVIERMRIGYAPGACVRAHLSRLGYGRKTLEVYGLVDSRGRDCFFRCLTFPLPRVESLYGRSIDDGGWRHRFLPTSKGGLYGWEWMADFANIILVEGLFDLAALWQAGFANTVAALGSHLNSVQLAELCGATGHRIYLCLDADENGGGQRAGEQLSRRLQQTGVEALRVALPVGYDPAALFAHGVSAQDFRRWLERARP